MKSIEIEIKVHIERFGNLLEFLWEKAVFIDTICQTDEYFTPPHENFIEKEPINKWLRLRSTSNGKYYITYKNYHYSSNMKSNLCDEYESKIENIHQLKNILNILNFKPVITVNKIRDIWEFKDYEISRDSVELLGTFLEIEYKKEDNKKPEIIIKEMINFLNKIGVGKIERNYLGYPYLLLNKFKKYKKK